jgi:hypothetical protein
VPGRCGRKCKSLRRHRDRILWLCKVLRGKNIARACTKAGVDLCNIVEVRREDSVMAFPEARVGACFEDTDPLVNQPCLMLTTFDGFHFLPWDHGKLRQCRVKINDRKSSLQAFSYAKTYPVPNLSICDAAAVIKNTITPPISSSIRSPVSTSSEPMGPTKPLRPARHSARVPRSGVYRHCKAGHLLGVWLELVWFCGCDWPLVAGCVGELVTIARGEVVED